MNIITELAEKLDDKSQKTLFVEFITKRFGFPHPSYIEEWVERFNTKAPVKFMDEQSKMIYSELLKSTK